MFLVFAVLVGLIPVVPAVIYLFQNGKTSPSQAVSRMVTGFNAFNFIVGLMAGGLAGSFHWAGLHRRRHRGWRLRRGGGWRHC